MIDFRILIVESDAQMSAMMTNSLQRFFTVEVVSTGKAALKRIPSFTPDLVIIDFQISDISSVQLQQEINKQYRAVHTVMLSSIDRNMVSLESMRRRAMDYIYRSDDSERFLSDVCKLVRYLVDVKFSSPADSALKTSGFYDLAKKLYEEKEWTVEEIQKMLNDRRRAS